MFEFINLCDNLQTRSQAQPENEAIHTCTLWSELNQATLCGFKRHFLRQHIIHNVSNKALDLTTSQLHFYGISKTRKLSVNMCTLHITWTVPTIYDTSLLLMFLLWYIFKTSGYAKYIPISYSNSDVYIIQLHNPKICSVQALTGNIITTYGHI